MERILMTGAAGGIGTSLRPLLPDLDRRIRLSDIANPDPRPAGHEEFVMCDITDSDAVRQLVDGVDVILHFGGISTENTAALIHEVNVIGTYNIYEAARRAGVSRILFASSNHVIGFHPRGTRIGANADVRPDSMYGVSKAYGEALARLYWHKFGIESAIVRIGSCFEAPKDRRMMATWMSVADMFRLIERVIEAPWLGCPVVYGVSDNPETWWDNTSAGYLGWRPRDSSEQFASMFDHLPPEDPADPAVVWQGGGFAKAGHFEN